MPHPFFAEFEVQELTTESFDNALEGATGKIVAVFFWGHACPNCDVAKNSLVNNRDRVKHLSLKWYSVNVYENLELGTRFGLHGVPTFFFFYQGKRLGRISPYPGIEPFMEALQKLQQNLSLENDLESK